MHADCRKERKRVSWCSEGLLLPLLALSFSCTVVTGARQGSEERLIGWEGDTFQPKTKTGGRVGDPTSFDSLESQGRKQWIQTLSFKPRAFVYHNFLSDTEAAHILRLARAQMKRSTVVGAKNEGVVDSVRTSAGTFLRRNQDKVIKSIEDRLAIVTHLPPSHQEDMQVLRYGPTNKYGPHIDGLERVMSVLIYLIEPEFGGETAFVQSEWLHPEMAEQVGNLSDCAAGHVAYKPKRGDMLMFFDQTPDYKRQDSHSMHTGCPVVRGVKWNAVKWIHGVPFRGDEYQKSLVEKFEPLPDPGVCKDLDERCAEWAAAGECEKNPGYMTGSNNGLGGCRDSCKVCEHCADGDEACFTRNRHAGGFLVVEDSEFQGLL